MTVNIVSFKFYIIFISFCGFLWQIFIKIKYLFLLFSRMFNSKLNEDKGTKYCNRVRIGNWYEDSVLKEYTMNPFSLETMKDGDLMLARYRKMNENLNAPTILITPATGAIAFGDKISLLAPNVPAAVDIMVLRPSKEWNALPESVFPHEYNLELFKARVKRYLIAIYPPNEDAKGLLLGGRLSSDELLRHRDLHDGSTLAGLSDLQPKAKNTFVITSADYSDRKGEHLKYNQEFLLALSKSVEQKPLYVRFDPNPIPGLCGMFPLYLSEHAMSNTRWRVLPVRTPNITRFEQEGKPVPINTDIVVNHCATNVNLGVDVDHSVHGFYEEIWPPLMKTCLDVFGRELPHNIWHIHVPVA